MEFTNTEITGMGWTNIVCKCDPENATEQIVNEVAKKRVHQTIPSHLVLRGIPRLDWHNTRLCS